MNRLLIITISLVVFNVFSSSAFAIDVCGTLRYWDDRDDRSNVTGSKLFLGTHNTNQPARRVLVHLYDQDGCNDFDLNCNEPNNDDWTGSAYSNASNGTFVFVTSPSMVTGTC